MKGFSGVVGALVLDLAAVVAAADAHDYSAYVGLTADQTVKAAVPTFGDPAAEMAAGGLYLIPDGLKLTSSPSRSNPGVAWPGAELAVEGTLTMSVSNGRDYCPPSIPPLALLPGGALEIAGAYSSVNAETCDIRSTEENPAWIKSTWSQTKSSSTYYAELSGKLTCSDAAAVLKITDTKGPSEYSRSIRVTSIPDFLGKIILTGQYTWLRQTDTKGAFSAGALQVTDGASLYIGAVSPTVGDLALDTGAFVELKSGNVITVTGSLTVDETAVLAVDGLKTLAFVSEGEKPKTLFLSACGAETAASVDRAKLLAAIVRSGVTYQNALDGVPTLALAETARADGGVDFYVTHEDVLPSDVTVRSGETLRVDKASLTLASLTLEDGSVLSVSNGMTVTAESLAIGETATICAGNLASVDFTYDTGSNEPASVTIISVAGSGATAVDRDRLWAAIARGGCTFRNALPGGIPRLKLAEIPRTDGGVDFAVTHDLVVRQIQSAGFQRGPYGFGMYEDYLSDGLSISASKDYYTDGCSIYASKNYQFKGRSLTVDELIGFYDGFNFTCEGLRVLSGTWLRQNTKNGTVYLRGSAHLYGMLNCRANGTGVMYVDADLSGDGNIVASLDWKMVRDKESACLGNVELRGDNSDWTGSVHVGCGKSASNGEAFTNVTMRISDPKSLGAGLPAFRFDSLKVARTCSAFVTETATFAAANRGWCLMNGSTVEVADGKTAVVNETVTFGGTVTKSGAGTWVLGGTAKFYDAANDTAVDTPNGETLKVAGGAIGVASPDALLGLTNLDFADGTGFAVDASSADAAFKASGADLSQMTLTTPADGVQVEFLNVTQPGEVAVATFASEADAARFVLRNPRGYVAERIVEPTVGGKWLLKADLSKTGLILLLK